MPVSETNARHELPQGEVLTLAEAAAYLRVPEEAVSELVASHSIPARSIGGEPRFLKRALEDWLMVDHPMWEDVIHLLAKHIISLFPKPEQAPASPGSKEAVLRQFGLFKQDADLEEQLAGIRARREAAGE